MNKYSTYKLLFIVTALSCLLAANSAIASIDGSRLIGLAVHQEVGRDIYIGAIHYNSQAPIPADIVNAAGPRTMEYRVVARRTGIRSLVGRILLQGELATGTTPNSNAIEFAEQLMGAVKGSLYAGDSLTISLNRNNTVTAALNGQELVSSISREVADYLLMGWVGERGASHTFRTNILSAKPDNSLRATYDKHAASRERIATIGQWNTTFHTLKATTKKITPASDVPVPELNIAVLEQLGPSNTQVALAADTFPQLISQQREAVVQGVQNTQWPIAIESSNPLAQSITAALAAPIEPVRLASLAFTREMIDANSVAIESEQAIDAIEYSKRLAAFNHNVMHAVNSEIRYPKAAVRRNIQGKLELDLTVTQAGNLLDVKIALTSGHRLLDKSAVKAAKAAFSTVALEGINTVSIAEYGDPLTNTLVIPVPISFVLTE